MALVEACLDPNVAFDDFVAGKGKGINILLQYGLISLMLSQNANIEKWPPWSRKNLDSRSIT